MGFKQGIEVTPFKLDLYGPPGVGKSTRASFAPGPVFFDLEGGIDHLDVIKTDRIESSKDLSSHVKEFIQKNLGQTAVFDSGDGVEKIITDEICKNHKITSLADLGYGKGYEELNAGWNKFLDMLDWLKRAGKNSIIISHELIKKYEDPRSEGYDRILLKMHQKSAGTLISRMDAVIYMTYDMTVVKGEKHEKAKAFGKGKRVLHCTEMPAFVAKNRYGMPDKIKPEELFNYLPKG